MNNPITEWLNERYAEVSPMEFYRELFPSGELDERGKMTKGKYTAIAIQVKGERKAYKFIVCDDLKPIDELIEQDDFLVISPVSYAGKRQTQTNARKVYAICFDLDGLRVDGERQIGLENLYHKIYFDNHLPEPSFIVSSGSGIHLYYFLDKPLSLFGDTLRNLWHFRMALTNGIWDETITEKSTNPQYESATQGFRAVGSITKNGVDRVRAFRVGGRISIEQLNYFVDEECQIKQSKSKSKLPIEEAKEKYPQWYENRVVKGKPKGYWVCNAGLYRWWLQKIIDGENKFPQHKTKGVQAGHRYFSIMALAIYARKCEIPREQLEKDALELIPLLDSRTDDESNHFTTEDIMKALEAYNASYITFPRDAIRDLTNIDIQPNKRNGRKQEVHLKIARSTKKILKDEGLLAHDGAPTKEKIVRDYVKNNPNYKENSISQIARECGVSRPTIYKWLPIIEAGEK